LLSTPLTTQAAALHTMFVSDWTLAPLNAEPTAPVRFVCTSDAVSATGL